MPSVDLYTDIEKEEFYNDVLSASSDTPQYIQNELHDVVTQIHGDGKEDTAKQFVGEIQDVMRHYGITYVDIDGRPAQQQAMAEILDYLRINVAATYWKDTLSQHALIESMNSIDFLMNNGFYTNQLVQESLTNAGADIARLVEDNVSAAEIQSIFSENRTEVINFLHNNADEFTGEYAHLFQDVETTSILVDTVIALL